MKLLLFLIVVALAVLAAAFTAFFWGDVVRAKPMIGRNPAYISVIQPCADYDDKKHCGAAFKQILQLYDYQVCADPDWDNGRCDRYYSPEEAHVALNNLPNWHD